MKNSVFVFIICLFSSFLSRAGSVEIKNDQLYIDQVPQPQLFGAELQYFRLRGGSEKNIPREKVLDLWNKALDRMVEARMNAISFYIPWDFHEYSEGCFDFTGTVDEDHDGLPDYPSRDLVTFLKLVEQKGFKHIMVRPGPYINAEWGFLGFGAIPLWFHEKYPDSHMRNSSGVRTKLYDYHNDDFLRHTKIWFKNVLPIIKPYLGKGRPISFVQIDNETNYMWQSVYDHDYSSASIVRYQNFLKSKYKDLKFLNQTHQHEWTSWNQILPPKIPWLNRADDQDWFLYHDQSMFDYLHKIRKMWEDLGVREPDVLFTLAESYNATENGVLPNYKYRNSKKTGIMTVNLYPKTYETPDSPFLNFPFKADHDVKAADKAKELYVGNQSEWVLGPEIQGGWWKGITVSPEARLQTYLTVIGHGLKALFVYYFNEGQNWQSDWAPNQIKPFYEQLKTEKNFINLDWKDLPESFWTELRAIVDQKVIGGLDVKKLMGPITEDPAELYFDAPLDGNANPRHHFDLLKKIGQQVIEPNQDFLGNATSIVDPVCLVKNSAQHTPSPDGAIDSILMNSEWAAGLLGYLLQIGINPKFVIWGINKPSDFNSCKIILFQDNDIHDEHLLSLLSNQIISGKIVVSFIGQQLSKKLKLNITYGHSDDPNPTLKINNFEKDFRARRSPLFTYSLSGEPNCTARLFNKNQIIGYECNKPDWNGKYWQIGTPFYDVFNSSIYSGLTDTSDRLSVLKEILDQGKIQSHFQLKKETNKISIFARESKADKQKLWITIKSGNNETIQDNLKVFYKISDDAVYEIKDLLNDKIITVPGHALLNNGFPITLTSFGSTVYIIQKVTGSKKH